MASGEPNTRRIKALFKYIETHFPELKHFVCIGLDEKGSRIVRAIQELLADRWSS